MNGLIHKAWLSHACESLPQTYPQLHFYNRLLEDSATQRDQCKAEGVRKAENARRDTTGDDPQRPSRHRRRDGAQKPPRGEDSSGSRLFLRWGPSWWVATSGVTLKIQEQHCWSTLQSAGWKHRPELNAPACKQLRVFSVFTLSALTSGRLHFPSLTQRPSFAL